VESAELREWRHTLGLTQSTLARTLGVAPNTVARWERGELRIGDPRRVRRTLRTLERRAIRHVGRRNAGRSPRNNLTPELTSFIGREWEITRVAERLGSTRLITLVGSGGVGKTRLATRVGARVLSDYADGVWLVEFATVAGTAAVTQAVASVLGLRERGQTPLLTTVTEELQSRQALLVLDNCEHVLDACAELVHRLLHDCPKLTILATSREPLRVIGEVRWPVPPLSLVSQVTTPGAGPSEAAQLFVERARSVQPDFAYSDDVAATIAGVCARLDGLPLAIELAAAQMQSLSVHALLDRLASTRGGLPILIDGPRDAPARHRTLRATIAWSYDLLSAEESALFRRLAPFRGCSREAVEAVCISAMDGARQSSVSIPGLHVTAHEGLSSLVTRNLLQMEDVEGGQPWYWMLETVREFALERLEASPEAAPVWRRHAWYYLRFVEQTEPRLRELREGQFLDRVQREYANVLAALDWCQAHGYAEVALRLAVGLFWFWNVRGYMAEGRARLEALLGRFPLAAQSGIRVLEHARALDALGHIATAQGDLATAEAAERGALAIFEHLDNTPGRLASLDLLSVIALKRDDLAAAMSYQEQRLSTLRQVNETAPDAAIHVQLGLTLAHMARLAHERGDDTMADGLFDEALEMVEHIDGTGSVGLVKLGAAEVARNRGDYERAHTLGLAALELLERADERRGSALALALLGYTSTARGDVDAAYEYLARSLRLTNEMNEPTGLAFVLDRFAALASTMRQHERALRLTGAAAALRDQDGIKLHIREQQYIDDQIQPSRATLGRMADAALEAGRSMRISDATAEALSIRSSSRANGLSGLSAREREVADLVGNGYTNRQIATELIVSNATVATHVRHILAKLDFRSRAQIAVWVNGHNPSLVGPEDATFSR
jgi:non-specific serine/threonine protein kinase